MSEGNGLPPGWMKTTVENLFTTVGGGTPSTNEPQYWEGDIPWITSADIYEDHSIAVRRKVTEEAISASATNKVPMGSVVVATRVGLGKVGLAAEDLCFSQDCQALLFDNSVLDSRYVVYQMRVAVAGFKAISRGTTISGVTKKQLLAVDFLLSPLAEQRRIVAAIEEQFARLDAGVAALERARANLKRYRASVLKAAVEGKLTEEWREERPDAEDASTLLARILEERRAQWEEAQLARYATKGQNPPKNWRSKYKEPTAPNIVGLESLVNGWCWATVAQTSHTVRYGSSAKTSIDSSGVPVLRMGNIQDGTLDLSSLKYLPQDHAEFPDLLLKQGDVLFNRTNSAELVGKSAVYKGTPYPSSYASYLIAVRLIEGCLPDYLSYFLNSSHGRAWVASVVSQQVGQANVNGTKLQALTFPLPPLAEQEEIVAEVERRLSVIEEVEAQVEVGLKRAARLRQSILKRAFEGRLVPQDPDDEPASVLLERIREQRAAQEKPGKTPRQRKRVSSTASRPNANGRGQPGLF